MHRGKWHLYVITPPLVTFSVGTSKLASAAGRYHVRAQRKAKGCAKEDFGKTTVGYVVHRLSRSDCSKN